MSGVTGTDADADGYRRKLRRAGIDEDSDLYEILAGNHDVVLEAKAIATECRAAVREGARGLSPEGERELVTRVARDMVSRAGRLFMWRSAAVAGAAALAVGMAAWGAGWWMGERSGLAQAQAAAGEFRHFLASDPAGAAVVLRLVRHNDFTKAEKGDACRKTRREVGGLEACDMPTWLGPVGKPGR